MHLVHTCTASALKAYSQLKKNTLCLLNRLVSSSNHGNGSYLGFGMRSSDTAKWRCRLV